jgi:hypothetical protein
MHRYFFVVKKEEPLTFDDVVDLIHAGMGVKWMFLAGFKGIQSYQDAFRTKNRTFPKFLF